MVLIRFALLTAMATAVSLSASADQRFSMTGTYEGVLACDDIRDGVPSGFSTPAVFKIVQEGSSRIALELNYGEEDDLGVCLYEGEISLDPGGDAVNGYYEACGGTFESRELARIFPAEAVEESFTFAADSIFQSTESEEGVLVVQGCKFVFTRVDRSRPQVQRCD